jgi:hypothetical protein
LITELLPASPPGIIVALALFGYATYSFVNGGIHAKGHGWKTKEEAPKPYYITQCLVILVALGQFTALAIKHFTRI